MFDPSAPAPLEEPFDAPSCGELLAIVAMLAEVAPTTETEAIDQLSALERIKSACAAAQARIADDLDVRQQARAAARSTLAPGDRADRRDVPGLASQIALARRESPHRGRGHLGLAVALRDLPETGRALARGDLSEEAAQRVVTETQDLSPEDRREADERLAQHARRTDTPWDGLGLSSLTRAVRRIAQAVDEDSVRRRRARAVASRRVTGRLLRDGTAQVTAVVSDVQYAAINASLRHAADAARAAGDPRTQGQVMADTFVQRLTGQVTAEAVPVAVGLVISAEALLGDDDSPGHLEGVGPIPAAVARRLVAASPRIGSSIRRLFARPGAGALLAMESRSRTFPAGLKAFIRMRDQFCRTPWCDAPIRHTDHTTPWRRGGRSEAQGGQGLCEACNYAKESAGWRHTTVPDADPHTVEIVTPTGHRHSSPAPAQPVPRSVEERLSDLSRHLSRIA